MPKVAGKGVGLGETGAVIGLAGAGLPAAGSSSWVEPAIGSAAAVTAAAIQSSAANRAAKMAAEASAKALAFQQEQYAQQRADFSRYQQAGVSASGRLGTQAMATPPSFRPGQPQQLGMPQGMVQPQGQMVLMQGPDGAQRPVPPNVAPELQTRGFRVIQGPGQPPQLGMVQGALWTVQAPDGQTKQLPPDVAQQFISRGARRLA